MKTIILSISAVILALLSAVGGFFGLMFRMEPGEESIALRYDVYVGLLVAATCFLGVMALPPSRFRTSRTRLRAALVPSVALAVLVPAMLFSYQWSILEGRRQNAQKLIESRTSEPDGPANGSRPIHSETNSTAPAAGSRR
jgi:hypothetical protein